MHGDPIGNVWIKREFEHTKLWPGPQFTMRGEIDMEKEYKEALAGQLVPVIEKGLDGSYLVYAEAKSTGGFIWMIEEGDTQGFIPVIKKNGVLMPAGMDPVDEMVFMAEAQGRAVKHHCENERITLRKKYRATIWMPRKKKKRARKEILIDWRCNEYMLEQVDFL